MAWSVTHGLRFLVENVELDSLGNCGQKSQCGSVHVKGKGKVVPVLFSN